MRTTGSPVTKAYVRRLIRAAEWVRRLQDSPNDDEALSQWFRWCADPDNLDAFEEILAVSRGFSAPEPRACLKEIIKDVDDNKHLAGVSAESAAIIRELHRRRNELVTIAFTITRDAETANDVVTDAVVRIEGMSAKDLAKIADLRHYCLMLVQDTARQHSRRKTKDAVEWYCGDDSRVKELAELLESVRDLPSPDQPALWELLTDTHWTSDEWRDFVPDVVGLSSQTNKVERKKKQGPKTRGRMR
jgi:DNA-directed RNA polymerase specialized sigma24 family protein